MSQISRLHQAEIANGNLIDADDINEELDQLVVESNGQDTRLTNIESSAITLAGVKTFSSAPKTDQIDERSAAAGVIIDSVLHKDGYIKAVPTTQPYVPGANGEFGLDTTNGAYKGMIGGTVISFATVPGFAGVLSKSANYTAVAADRASLISCTGTFTLSLTAAATLGGTWFCSLRNDSTGVITVDPNASETIDGKTTIKLYQGEACTVMCDGANFKTVGRSRGPVLIQSQTASGASSVDFTVGLDDPEGWEFYIDSNDFTVSATADVWARVSEDGSTWKSGASDYTYQAFSDATTSVVGTTSAGAAQIALNSSSAGGQWKASTVSRFRLGVLHPAGTSNPKEFMAQTRFVEATGSNNVNGLAGGTYKGTNNAIVGVRILPSTGTCSGTLKLFMIRGI